MDALPPIVVALRASIGEFKAKMGEAGDEVKKFDEKTSTAMNKVSTVGKFALLGTAAAAGALGYESLKSAGDFEKSTNVLVTAAGESTSGLVTVRDGIKDIATTTGTSWQSLTDGMYTVEKAGIHGADGITVLRAAAQGAAEEGASLSSVTNAMTSVMASYNLKASDSVAVMNAIKTAAGGTKDTMENFASSLSTVIPIASANKISFAEVGGALGTLTSHGTSAAEATQELSNTIRNLAAPNAVATKEMAAFGLSATDVTQNLGSDKRGLAGTIELLSKTVMDRMGPAGTALLNTFQTSKAATADLATEMDSMSPATKKLAQDLESGSITASDYSKSMNGMTEDQKVLASQFRTTYDRANGFNQAIKLGGPEAVTYSDAMKKLTGGATGLNTSLMLTGSSAAGLSERTKDVAKSMADGGTEVEGWASTQKLFNIQMAELSQKVQVAAIDIGTKLIPVVLSVGHFIADNTKPFLILAGVIGGALVIAMGVYIANLAIAGAKSVVEFGKMMISSASWLASAIGDVGAWISLHVEAMATWVATTAGDVAAWLSLHTAAAATWISETAADVGAWLSLHLAAMGTWISTTAGDVAAWVSLHAAAMAEWVATAAGEVAAWLSLQLEALATSAAAGASWALDMAGSATLAAVDWVAEMGLMAATAISSAAAMILPFLPLIVTIGLIGIAAYELYQHWDQVWGFIKQIASDVWDFLKGVFDALVQGGLWVIRTEIDGLEATWNGAWSAISSVVSSVWGFLQGVFSAVVGAGLRPIESAIQTLEGVWSSVWGSIKGAVSDAWNFISGIFGSISGAVSSVMGAIGGISSAASSVGGVLGALHIPGFASGVTNFSGGLAMVGEDGPELVNLPSGSDVIPTPQVKAMSGTGRTIAGGGGAGGGSNMTVMVTINGSYYGQGGVSQLADQLHEALLRKQSRSPLGLVAG
jgi:hypothetical protein